MKKILTLLLSVLLLACGALAFTACDKDGKSEEITVKINIPDGTPALALAQVITDGVSIEGYKTDISFEAADVIAANLAKNSIHLAILPTVSGAKIYQNGAKIKLVSTNVFGNLFIVGVNSTANSLQALVGKLVYVTTGTTIQMLQAILDANDIEWEESGEAIAGKVAFESYSQASEVIPLMVQADKSGEEAYGVFGEPQVTQLRGKTDNDEIIVDFQKAWKEMTTFDGYPQASLFVTDAFAASHAEYVSAFTDKLKDNAEWLNSAENIAKFQTAVEALGSTLASLTLTTETILNCNLGFQTAASIKESVKDYVPRLGGTAPDDNFFYSV